MFTYLGGYSVSLPTIFYVLSGCRCVGKRGGAGYEGGLIIGMEKLMHASRGWANRDAEIIGKMKTGYPRYYLPSFDSVLLVILFLVRVILF